jgi:hypothetical protein
MMRMAELKVRIHSPPAQSLGLSRDLLIRVLAYELQERAQNGANAALRRRLQSLAAASANAWTLPLSAPA